MIQIERNVPIPEIPQGRRPSYPWAKMEVGDSFVVDKPIEFRSIASRDGTRTGRQFSCKREGVGWRVWRVK